MPVCTLLLALIAAGADPPLPPPNVVIVFVDDMGYGDLGCFGGEHVSTPRIDAMAAEGRKLTSFYVAQPVCSASRAALLTGCYPNRLGIHGALGPSNTHGLHADETTIAEVLGGEGYATAAFGKWHLGHHEPFLPPNHGFDAFHGIPYSNDMWPLHPEYVNLPPDIAGRKRGFPNLPMIHGTSIVDPRIEPGDQQRFTTDFTERAVNFMRAHRDQPFFLYLAHPMPHVPLFVAAGSEGRSGKGFYGDVIAEIDWSVGRILDTLVELGIDEQTLVIFTSDNGPWLSYGNHAGRTGGLREGKGTTFEGGVRVPFVVRWPGVIPAATASNTPMMTIDLLPTIAALVGAAPPSPIDGRDGHRLLLGLADEAPQETYYFYYRTNELQAIRHGRWKLHLPHTYRTPKGPPGADGWPGKYDYSAQIGPALFDLEADPNETTDVADAHPGVVEDIMARAEAARADLGDSLTKRSGSGTRAPGRLD